VLFLNVMSYKYIYSLQTTIILSFFLLCHEFYDRRTNQWQARLPILKSFFNSSFIFRANDYLSIICAEGCYLLLNIKSSPYFVYCSNLRSELTRLILSDMACAIIRRSLGSLWFSYIGNIAYSSFTQTVLE
jgi:hypothetical protein